MGRAWLVALLVVLAFVVILFLTLRRPPSPPGPSTSSGFKIGVDLPDPRLTPGDVLTTSKSEICRPGYARSVRNVPQSVKNQVYRLYGITSRKPGEYEVDHLISLQLGGSNSVKNLWPQSYHTRPANAHVKDQLENKLHDLMCSGQISVQEAQQSIAKDWIAAYRKYIGPLP
jgi:hypothetical protein